MKTGIAAVIACCALALAAGCGSSSNSSGGAATTATATTAATTSSSAGATLKGDTTPKYAVPSPSAPVQSGLVQIAYRNIAIAPDTVRVKLGSTIRWTNYDSAQANVTSEGGPLTLAPPRLRRRRHVRTEGQQARGDPLRVHALPGHHERHDRSGRVMGRPAVR